MTPEYLKLMAEIEKEEVAEREKDPFFAVMSDIYKLEKAFKQQGRAFFIPEWNKEVDFDRLIELSRQSIANAGAEEAERYYKYLNSISSL